MKSNIENNKLSGGDGIRGLACLIVLVLHAVVFNFPQSLPYILGCGKIGVWLFFVLSAFLLTYQLELRGFSWTSVSDYAIGRFLRIIPLFVLTVLISYYLGKLGDWQNVKDVVLFRNGYAHLWTIPVEFKFYFVLPIISFLFINIKKNVGFFCLIVFCFLFIILHQLIWPYWNLQPDSINTIWYLPCFMLGCAAAVCWRNIRDYINNRNATFIGTTVLICLFLSAPGMRLFLFDIPLIKTNLRSEYIFVSFGWIFFIITQLDGKGIYGRFLTKGLLPSVGKWSYSIYLFHVMIYENFLFFYPKNITWILCYIIVTIFVGWVSYTYLELPIESFRKYIRRWILPSIFEGLASLVLRIRSRCNLSRTKNHITYDVEIDSESREYSDFNEDTQK